MALPEACSATDACPQVPRHSNAIPCIQGHSTKSYNHPPHEHRVQDGDADTLRYRDSDGIQQPHQSYIGMSASEPLCASRWQLPRPTLPLHEAPHRFTHKNKHHRKRDLYTAQLVPLRLHYDILASAPSPIAPSLPLRTPSRLLPTTPLLAHDLHRQPCHHTAPRAARPAPSSVHLALWTATAFIHTTVTTLASHTGLSARHTARRTMRKHKHQPKASLPHAVPLTHPDLSHRKRSKQLIADAAQTRMPSHISLCSGVYGPDHIQSRSEVSQACQPQTNNSHVRGMCIARLQHYTDSVTRD